MFRQCILRCPMHTPPFMGSCICHLVTLHALLFSCNLHSPTVIIFLPFNIKLDQLMSLSILVDFISGRHGVSSWKFNKSIWHSIWIWCWHQQHGIVILMIYNCTNYNVGQQFCSLYFYLWTPYYLMRRQYLWPNQIYVCMNRGTKRKKAIRKNQLH